MLNSLFDLKPALTEYLISESSCIVCDNDEDDWSTTLNSALLQLGEHICNKYTDKSI